MRMAVVTIWIGLLAIMVLGIALVPGRSGGIAGDRPGFMIVDRSGDDSGWPAFSAGDR